jgi:maleylacetate reductase
MTSLSFVHESRAQRVRFGAGSLAAVADEVAALGARRAIVLCTPEQRATAEDVAGRLGDRAAGIFAGAVMHVPLEVAREARAYAASVNADCAVAVGGGSTTGLGKAIALESALPILAVPTTYAGSEMTPIWGITEGGVKKTGRDVRVLPRGVLYDPELTLSLPVAMTVTSAINAIAHAVEGLYAPDGNPVLALQAEEGIRAAAAAVLRLPRHPGDIDARSEALYAAWLCGSVLGSVSMGLHHKLCHTLGGTFDLPHADVHTVILPHALAFNAAHAPQAVTRIARALDAAGVPAGRDVPARLFALIEAAGAPTSLAAIGMPAGGLDRAADLAAQNQYPNPRPLERPALRALLERAHAGASPE